MICGIVLGERRLSAEFASARVMQSTPQNKEGTLGFVIRLAFVLVIWIFYFSGALLLGPITRETRIEKFWRGSKIVNHPVV